MSVFDLVLRNGVVIDGTGSPVVSGDVAIDGDTIAAVGKDLHGNREIACNELVVSPGFLDTHSHSDLYVLGDPLLPMKVRQGITLEVLGQDGISVAPVRPDDRWDARRTLAGLLGDLPESEWRWESVGDYLNTLDERPASSNLAYAVPHGTLRTYVMGAEDREPTLSELASMTAELERGLNEGAIGLSTGLIYPPCCYSTTEELVALGTVLARRKAPLLVHMRSESDLIEQAVDEMIEVGQRSGCSIHISHLKIAGGENFSCAASVIQRIEDANARGVRVTGDQYPYAAGATLLGAILPPWAHEGGASATLERLAVPEQRARMRADMEQSGPIAWDSFWKWTGPAGIVISDIPSGRHPTWLGKSLAEAAREDGKDPMEFAFDLLEAEQMGVGMVSHSQSEEVVERFVKLPFLNGGTDGLLGGHPHPRAYGTYPRYLGHCVRERKLVALPEMIRKLTSQAARAMNLNRVGEVRAGHRADLVVFDPDAVRDRATFEKPIAYPDGIIHVVVRGQLAVEDSEVTGTRAGRVVRRPEADIKTDTKGGSKA